MVDDGWSKSDVGWSKSDVGWSKSDVGFWILDFELIK